MNTETNTDGEVSNRTGFSSITRVDPNVAAQAQQHQRGARGAQRNRLMQPFSHLPSPDRTTSRAARLRRAQILRNRSATNGQRRRKHLGIVALADARNVKWTAAAITVKQVSLNHERNKKCRYCRAVQWFEERMDCRKNGKEAMLPLSRVPADLWHLFNTAEFERDQRKYNGLYSLTAMGAGSPTVHRTWTQPTVGPSMPTLDGKAYHRIFDLYTSYSGTTVQNCSRFYIFDGELNSQAQDLSLNSAIVVNLRNRLICRNSWCRTFPSAVDEVLNSLPLPHDAAPAYIEFQPITNALAGPD